MRPTLVLRTGGSRPIAVAGWVVCGIVAVLMVVDGMAPALLAWPALVALVAYALWWRPAVEVSDGGVTLREPLRDVHVPWPAVRGFEARWSFTVLSTEGRHASWALPVRSASGRALRGLRPRPDAAPGADVVPGLDVLGGHREVPVEQVQGTAETALTAAQDRLDALRAAGHLPTDAPAVPVARSWRVAELAAAAALVAVGVLLG